MPMPALTEWIRPRTLLLRAAIGASCATLRNHWALRWLDIVSSKPTSACIEGLTLTFGKGALSSMTARSGLDALKAHYDASGGGKDKFSYIDVGLNPEARLPTNSGRMVWVAPGAVTVGMGDNTGWGGTNVSTFGLAGSVEAATLSVDGKALIERRHAEVACAYAATTAFELAGLRAAGIAG